MRIRTNKENRLILCFLYLLPIMDMLNGVLIRKFSIYGLGSTFHLVLTVYFFYKAFINKRIYLDKYGKSLIALVLVFAISSAVNSIIINNYQPDSLDRCEKIISNLIILSSFIVLFKRNLIDDTDLEKVFYYYCSIIAIASFIANVFKLGNYTYENVKLGMTGFFTGSNEPVAIYIVLNIFLVYKIYFSKKINYVFLFFLNEINLIYTQSKSAYLFTVIFALIFFIILLRKTIKNNKINLKILLFVIPILVVTILFGKSVIGTFLNKFIDRQVFLQKSSYYSKSSFLNFVFSGRLDKLSDLTKSIYQRSFISKIFQIFFGQGLNFGYLEIIEIDIFDIFLYGGILGMAIITYIMISILKDIKNNTNSNFIIFAVLCIFFFSCTAGHVWTGGISGAYFAILCSFFIFVQDSSRQE